MGKSVQVSDTILTVTDVFGKQIRTTKSYWNHITTTKHQDLDFDIDAVKQTLINPDEAFTSVQDSYILLFYKRNSSQLQNRMNRDTRCGTLGV